MVSSMTQNAEKSSRKSWSVPDYARRRFAAFVDSGKGDGHSELFYGGETDKRVVGEADFVKKVIKPTHPVKAVPLRTIVAYVAEGSGLTEAALKAPGRSRDTAQARALIAWLAMQTRSCSLTDVAVHFGRSPSTLSHLVARLEKLSHSTESLAETLRKHLYALMQA